MPRQDVAVEWWDATTGVWHDLVANDDVLADTPIVIIRGQGDEGAAQRPSLITCRLANDDDMYRISNPLSPLYGKTGVNTPLHVTVTTGGNTAFRGIGEISSWRCGQTRDFRATPRRGKAWVDVEASGLSQRLGQWTAPVQSTMTRGMLSFGTSILGVWPLEDESETTVLSNLAPGGLLGQYLGDASTGDSEHPGGSARSVKIGTTGQITGRFLTTAASGWQISAAFKLAAAPSSASYEELFTWTDSLNRRWTWEANNVNYGWTVYDSDGTTVLASLAAAYGAASPTGWVRFKMRATVSAGTLTYEPSWYAEGAATEIGVSGTFAATSTGRLVSWRASANAWTSNGWYTGVIGISSTAANMFTAAIIADFNGHVGETAGNRFVRIMTELGLSYATNGDLDLSQPMGAQPAVPLSEILTEIRDTDDAILFESRGTLNLILTMRNFRYNRTPTLTLNVMSDPSGLPSLPDEVTDDLPVHNKVTAQQRNGGEATAEDSTSIMGTAAPPAGRGEYRQSVNVNVASEADQLPAQASWWLKRGTVALPRFPEVVVNLAALPADRVAEVEAVTIGYVIEIVNYREDTIRLNVIGTKETIGLYSRTIVFTCVPDQQFNVGVYDDTAYRYDSASTTVEDLTPTETLWDLTIVDAGDVWSTTAVPYDVMVNGERCTITAMTAVAGTGPYTQTATARRSVNGVYKRHAAGSSVRIATPGRWAL